tara:strand:+ start:918 stop:1490 length:573 start_codon:yes stop_codon:yes gene_type:complete
MCELLHSLNPLKRYAFHTPEGKSHPMLVKEFKKQYGNVDIYAIELANGKTMSEVWDVQTSWEPDAYATLVRDFIRFIDCSQKPGDTFIINCMEKGLSPAGAVTAWFESSPINVVIEHHLGADSGLLDIDITGIDTVRRIVLPMDAKDSDLFNIYYDVSRKGGCLWKRDVITTLRSFFRHIAEPESAVEPA